LQGLDGSVAEYALSSSGGDLQAAAQLLAEAAAAHAATDAEALSAQLAAHLAMGASPPTDQLPRNNQHVSGLQITKQWLDAMMAGMHGSAALPAAAQQATDHQSARTPPASCGSPAPVASPSPPPKRAPSPLPMSVTSKASSLGATAGNRQWQVAHGSSLRKMQPVGAMNQAKGKHL
jgi:hypothetical protein